MGAAPGPADGPRLAVLPVGPLPRPLPEDGAAPGAAAGMHVDSVVPLSFAGKSAPLQCQHIRVIGQGATAFPLCEPHSHCARRRGRLCAAGIRILPDDGTPARCAAGGYGRRLHVRANTAAAAAT